MSEFSKFEIKQIKNNKEWELLDSFIYELKFASFLSYSFWLDSYVIIPKLVQKIGFLLNYNGDIIGGISGIQIGFWPFRITIFPSGPFFLESVGESYKNSFLNSVLSESAIKNSTLVQLALRENLLMDQKFENGKIFRKIYLDNGIGSVKVEKTEEEQLNSFKIKVRRDIKVSINKNLVLKVVDNQNELTNVYAQFKKNAYENKYKIRPFWMYKHSWEKSLKTRKSIFFLIFYNNEIKGAAWFINAGRTLNYIMGASSKEKPSLYVGYFIQWNAIKLAIEMGYDYYNISVGGIKGVESFKNDFGRALMNLPKYRFRKAKCYV